MLADLEESGSRIMATSCITLIFKIIYNSLDFTAIPGINQTDRVTQPKWSFTN